MDDKKLEKEYKEKKFDIWDELMNAIQKEREKIKIKANEYIKQGIVAPEAFAKASDEFQEEVEKITKRNNEKFFELDEEYRKKGLLAGNVNKIYVGGKEWKKRNNRNNRKIIT